MILRVFEIPWSLARLLGKDVMRIRLANFDFGRQSARFEALKGADFHVLEETRTGHLKSELLPFMPLPSGYRLLPSPSTGIVTFVHDAPISEVQLWERRERRPLGSRDARDMAALAGSRASLALRVIDASAGSARRLPAMEPALPSRTTGTDPQRRAARGGGHLGELQRRVRGGGSEPFARLFSVLAALLVSDGAYTKQRSSEPTFPRASTTS